MNIFIMCAYITCCVLLYIVTSKHNKLTRELIDTLVKEKDFLIDQNKKLSDIIKN